MLHRRRAPLLAGFAAVFVALAAPAGAQTPVPASGGVPGAAGAVAASVPADAFTVSGVRVDISAANANAARDQAIREAQVKAWDQMYKRLVPGAASTPRVSDNDLARLVQGFEIDDEKVSATRYVGSFTVTFRPNAVRETLGGTGQQYVEPPGKPLVVLPVTVTDGRSILWEDRTAWREAWEGRTPGAALVPLVVPDGELADISAIGVGEALSGTPEAIGRIAQRYNAGGVVVVRIDLPGAGPDAARGMTVDVTRYGLDGTRESQQVSVKADPSDRPGDLLNRAVTFVAAAVDESWRRENTVATGPEQATTVRVPLSRLDDWVEARRRLTGVPAVTRTDVLSLSRTEAVVALTHRGDVERLRQALARRDLGLARAAATGYPAGYPGGYAAAQPVLPGQPAALVAPSDWQLRLLPRGSGSDASSAAPLPGAVQPTAGAPTPIVPGTVPPGAPPRALGTLPATGGTRY